MRTEKISYPGKEHVWLDCYILDSGLRLGRQKERPAVIICPGGGYVYLSPREGEPVAMAYGAKGLHAFVLHYSLGWEAAGFAPLAELDWAVKTLREHAKEWNLDASRILACGFSAGGHLALAGGLLAEHKPDALILGYPAVCLKGTGDALMCRLLTGKKEPSPEEERWLDLAAQVTNEAPPLFVFTTGEDMLTRSQTLELVTAYDRKGLLCEYHLFQFGPHGYSLANAASADGSSQVLDPHVEKWLDLSVEWLFGVLGKPEHQDYSTSHIMEAIRELGIELPQMGDGGNA